MSDDSDRVDPDGVDDDMKRYRWVCWGHDGKAPTDPTTGGHARHNDAATWESWDEALALAERKGYGVGFPFEQAAPFVGLDIDVPHSAEWVPDFDRLGGAVVERSMSGNRHVFLRGVEVPDWWTDISGDGQDTDEIGVYENSKYMTVSGDVLEGHGPPIEEVSQFAFEAWLKDAWTNWHEHHLDVEGYPDGVPAPPWEPEADRGTDASESTAGGGSAGDGSGASSAGGDGTTIDDLLRRETEAAMPSVHDVLSGSYPEGKRVSHPVHGSKTGKNFMIDEGGETWVCWRHGDRSEGVTGGALHLLGIDAGIIDCGEWETGGLDSDTWYSIFEEARDRGFDLPRRSDVVDSIIEQAGRDGRAKASTDGGTAIRTAGTDAAAGLSPDEPGSDDDETAGDGDTDADDPWARVRGLYAADESENSKVAMNYAVQLLGEEIDVAARDESEALYTYDPADGCYHRRGEHRVQEHLNDDRTLGVTFYPARARNINGRGTSSRR